jgi:hypothetical protein
MVETIAPGLEKIFPGATCGLWAARCAGLVYGVVSHKASHTLRPLLIYCASPSEFKSILIRPQVLSDSNQETASSEAVRNLGGNYCEFFLQVSLSYCRFQHVKSYDKGSRALLPIGRKSCYGFYRPQKS